MLARSLQLPYNEKNVAYLVVTFRAAHKFSAKFVAAKIGVSKSTYSKIENGQQELTTKKMVNICKVYEITPAEFFLHFNQQTFFV